MSTVAAQFDVVPFGGKFENCFYRCASIPRVARVFGAVRGLNCFWCASIRLAGDRCTYMQAVVDTYIHKYVCHNCLFRCSHRRWHERCVGGTDTASISGPLWPWAGIWISMRTYIHTYNSCMYDFRRGGAVCWVGRLACCSLVLVSLFAVCSTKSTQLIQARYLQPSDVRFATRQL